MVKIKDKYVANIVGHWDFRRGSIADNSGNYNNGTLGGTPFWQNSKKGKTLNFDGSTDYIDIDTAVGDLASDTVGTWTAWIKTTDATTTQEIISFGDTDADTRIQFDINNSLLRALIGETGTTQWAVDTDNAVFVNGEWIHIALVQDGTEPILYVNGVAVAQTFSTSTDKTYWFNDLGGLDNGRIGCGNWNNGGNATFLGGNVLEAMILDTNLTGQEVSQLYEESKQERPFTMPEIQTNNPVYGNELVTNGTFDADSDWIKGTGWSISGGVASCDGSQVASTDLYQNNVVEFTKKYKIQVTVSGYSAGNLKVLIGGVSSVVAPDISANGTYEYYYINSSSTDRHIYLKGDTNFVGSVDDVTVIEINPRYDVYISDGKGWNVSDANVTSGFVENTEWSVGSGSWQVDDSYSNRTGSQLLSNNDFENWTGGVLDNWLIYRNATVTEQTTDPVTGSSYVRVAYTDADNAGIYKTNLLTVGKKYRITGWARTDGTGSADIYIGGLVIHGTIDGTTWTYFDIEAEADGINFYLVNDTNGASYVEFDDVRLYEAKTDSKKLTCEGTGLISIPSKQAVGTWEFEISPDFAGIVSRVYFMASDATSYTVTNETYFFSVINTGAIQIYESNGAGGAALKFTSNELFPEHGWQKYRVTRTSAGVFTAYYLNSAGAWVMLTDSGAGAMPFTDTTWTSSNFVLYEAQTDNRIRNFRFIPYIE